MVQAPIPQTPDVIRAGEVMATLDDWRAIVFAIMFICVFMVLFFISFTVWREREMQKERQQMRELAKSFAESAKVVGESLASLTTKIAVLSALTARAETIIGTAREETSGGSHD